MRIGSLWRVDWCNFTEVTTILTDSPHQEKTDNDRFQQPYSKPINYPYN